MSLWRATIVLAHLVALDIATRLALLRRQAPAVHNTLKLIELYFGPYCITLLQFACVGHVVWAILLYLLHVQLVKAVVRRHCVMHVLHAHVHQMMQLSQSHSRGQNTSIALFHYCLDAPLLLQLFPPLALPLCRSPSLPPLQPARHSHSKISNVSLPGI